MKRLAAMAHTFEPHDATRIRYRATRHAACSRAGDSRAKKPLAAKIFRVGHPSAERLEESTFVPFRKAEATRITRAAEQASNVEKNIVMLRAKYCKTLHQKRNSWRR